ncbi:MAG: 2Fe-2S iron-sulfur cluster binding domain-containing protein [Synechococcaceae cyanobacterium SM2_3_60]|nr:2Fe-2S iron-sulfur cluster binding domain-containing protein [Synechococcaceae cyanobacterium SM2_3_60]
MVNVRFLPDNIVVTAEPGEPLLKVARRAGQSIPTGCLRGSCHACVVESDCWGTICACITAVPIMIFASNSGMTRRGEPRIR